MNKVIAVCGAGGKTSKIWQLRDEYVKKGKKVFITTTTHMYCEPFCNLSVNAEEIIKEMKENGWVMAGVLDEESSKEKRKIKALPKACYEAICNEADLVLVEADGAKQHSVKFPGKKEPVLPANLTDVYVIMGRWDLGKPISEVVHRWHLLDSDPHKILTMSHILEIFHFYDKEKIYPFYPQANITWFLTSRSESGIDYEKL